MATFPGWRVFAFQLFVVAQSINLIESRDFVQITKERVSIQKKNVPMNETRELLMSSTVFWCEDEDKNKEATRDIQPAKPSDRRHFIALRKGKPSRLLLSAARFSLSFMNCVIKSGKYVCCFLSAHSLSSKTNSSTFCLASSPTHIQLLDRKTFAIFFLSFFFNLNFTRADDLLFIKWLRAVRIGKWTDTKRNCRRNKVHQ